MKNYLKYLNWVPFGISIGALILYLRYTIMFKLDSNLIMTDKVKESLNQYLIILFISLFVGLAIVLFKKIFILVNSTSKEKINFNNNEVNYADNKFKDIIENENESNFAKDIKKNKVIKVRLSEPILGNSVKAKVIDTDEDIEILLLDDDIDLINQMNNSIRCPKCGKMISKDAFICTHCGVLVNKEIFNEISEVFNKNNKQEISYEVKKIPKQNKFITFLVNFIIIIICIFLIFLIVNKIMNQKEKNYNNINIESQIK